MKVYVVRPYQEEDTGDIVEISTLEELLNFQSNIRREIILSQPSPNLEDSIYQKNDCKFKILVYDGYIE
jgi:hypothetical protein